MCRYACSGPYKRHYVCFACRKAFKQPPIADFLAVRGRGYVYEQLCHLWSNTEFLERRENELGHRLAELEEEYRDATHKCPECGEPMIDMGLDFKAPKQNDAKAWRTLQCLYRVGHAFHTCGCDGPGWIPKSTADYCDYLETKKTSYLEQLAQVQSSNKYTADAKKEAVDYWASRIQAIDRELAAIT